MRILRVVVLPLMFSACAVAQARGFEGLLDRGDNARVAGLHVGGEAGDGIAVAADEELLEIP